MQSFWSGGPGNKPNSSVRLVRLLPNPALALIDALSAAVASLAIEGVTGLYAPTDRARAAAAARREGARECRFYVTLTQLDGNYSSGSSTCPGYKVYSYVRRKLIS